MLIPTLQCFLEDKLRSSDPGLNQNRSWKSVNGNGYYQLDL